MYLILQGRVRTKTVKKASRQIIEKYYNRLTQDFHTNKRVAEEVAVIQSKRLRNKIAGFTTVCCSHFLSLLFACALAPPLGSLTLHTFYLTKNEATSDTRRAVCTFHHL